MRQNQQLCPLAIQLKEKTGRRHSLKKPMKKLITILLILQVMSVDAQNNGWALKYADESLKKNLNPYL